MERAPFEPRGSLLRQDNGINHVNDPVTAEDVGFGHFGVVNHHHSTLNANRHRLPIYGFG